MIEEFENESLLLKEDVRDYTHRPWPRLREMIIICLLVISLLVNVFLSKSRPSCNQSAFAQLSPTLSVPWLSKSPYHGQGTEEDADRAWDAINIDNGSLALDYAYIEKMGLPRAQPFPWDGTKGIYLLNGYHGMHCLKSIRTWIRQADQGIPTDLSAGHMFHCLDALRQDIECYADDTPRYTGFQEPGRSGTGQVRQCRDWSRMETWAQQHTACWRYMPELQSQGRVPLETFRFCPEGSPYKEKMESYFRDHV